PEARVSPRSLYAWTYSASCRPRKITPRTTVSNSQFFRAVRLFARRAWWARVRVTLELISSRVLISGSCQGLMVSVGPGKALGSGLFTSGQEKLNSGHNRLEEPFSPTPSSHGPARIRT